MEPFYAAQAPFATGMVRLFDKFRMGNSPRWCCRAQDETARMRTPLFGWVERAALILGLEGHPAFRAFPRLFRLYFRVHGANINFLFVLRLGHGASFSTATILETILTPFYEKLKDPRPTFHPPSKPAGAPSYPHQSFTPLNRKALVITETELKLMAALAMIGLNNRPKKG
jgi:hypothetical protein